MSHFTDKKTKVKKDNLAKVRPLVSGRIQTLWNTYPFMAIPCTISVFSPTERNIWTQLQLRTNQAMNVPMFPDPPPFLTFTLLSPNPTLTLNTLGPHLILDSDSILSLELYWSLNPTPEPLPFSHFQRWELPMGRCPGTKHREKMPVSTICSNF